MGLAKLRTKIGVEDYLEGEKISNVRREYVDGEVFAMAGASDRHHRISLNLAKKLDDHLQDSKCESFMAEMKLRTDEKTFYYPDVFVSCERNPSSRYFREEAVLVIEVVSESTRQIDRREKLRIYQSIPTLREYVVVEQAKMKIEIHRRLDDGRWLTRIYNHNDLDEIITFESVGVSFTLEEIYRRVSFD